MIYYIRKGQSQVGVTISAVLAQADIVTNIWRAKRAPGPRVLPVGPGRCPKLEMAAGPPGIARGSGALPEIGNGSGAPGYCPWVRGAARNWKWQPGHPGAEPGSGN